MQVYVCTFADMIFFFQETSVTDHPQGEHVSKSRVTQIPPTWQAWYKRTDQDLPAPKDLDHENRDLI